MRLMICLSAAVCVAGCAKEPPVRVVGDTYCRIARPISWSTADTKPTITEIRQHNAKRAKVCGRRR